MKQILVCGDWHGSSAAAKSAAKTALRHNCTMIVQVGDFGFWPHTDPEYVDQVNRHLTKQNLSLVWVDGNHENFDALFSGDWTVTERGFWRIADKIYYSPRGNRWEWDGVTFLSLGGAYSIDKDWRLAQGPEGMYWWRQETITQKDVMEATKNRNHVDVMITHDMPDGTELGVKLTHNAREDQWNRKAVRAVVDVLKPKVLFHGHYHHRKDSLLQIEGAPPVQIVSLDMWKGLPLESNWVVLDLDEVKPERRLA